MPKKCQDEKFSDESSDDVRPDDQEFARFQNELLSNFIERVDAADEKSDEKSRCNEDDTSADEKTRKFLLFFVNHSFLDIVQFSTL